MMHTIIRPATVYDWYPRLWEGLPATEAIVARFHLSRLYQAEWIKRGYGRAP